MLSTDPMRSPLVFVAVATVLLCPYSCAVRAAASRATADTESGKACCERCRCERAPKHDEAPSRESREEDAPCFCGGAVFDASARAADDFLFSEHGVLSVDSAIGVHSPAPEQIATVGAVPPPILSGMLLRIAIVSFLI